MYQNQWRHTVLLVENDPSEIQLAQRAAAECGHEFSLVVLQDADAVIDWLNDDEALIRKLPHIIMINLRLPKLDGLAVLRKLRIAVATRAIPILVFSEEYTQADVLMSYQIGANSFVAKPGDLQQFIEFFCEQLPYWLEPRQRKLSLAGR
ncbi:MAG: response regulator [Nitrosomonadales bacterium]|nr:response regulator [Nitrosomonadales bacterium]